MKLALVILYMARIGINAYRMRGSEHVPADRSTRELHFRRRYTDNRQAGLTLFLVQDDSSPRTTSCTNDLADELYDCVDVVITGSDADTDPSDYVYYVDSGTNCDRALADIENEIGCTLGYRRYYYGGYRRYWSDRNNRWYRYYDSNKSKKDDMNDDYTRRHRWWDGNGDNKDDGDNNRHRSWWHEGGDNHVDGGGDQFHGGWDHDHGDGGNGNAGSPKDDGNNGDGNR